MVIQARDGAHRVMFRLGEAFSVAAPKAFAGVAAIACNLLLLQLFGPEQFGALSFCVAAILLADGILGSAIDMGVLRLAPMYLNADRSRTREIELAALAVKAVVFLPLLVVLPFVADLLAARLLGSPDNGPLLVLTCWAAFGMLLLRSALVHTQVEGRFTQYGALEWVHQLLKFGGIALLILIGQASPRAVLVLHVAAPAAALVAAALLRRRALRKLPRIRWTVVRELLAFVKWSLLTFAFAALISRMDVFLLAGLSSMHELGIFSAGQVFATIPELLGTHLAIVLSPKIMPALGSGGFPRFFRRFQLALYAASGGILIAAWIVLGSAFSALLPESFGRSREVVLILLPGALAGFATFPLTLSVLMFLRPRFLFALDCITAPVMVLGYLYLIPAHGAVGAAWVTSVGRLAKAAIAQAAAWRSASGSPDVLPGAAAPALVSIPGKGNA